MDPNEDGAVQYKRAGAQPRLFIDLHTGGMTQREAYPAAGYTGKAESAPGVLAHTWSKAIKWRKEQISKGSEAARIRSVQRLTRYAEGNLADLFPEGLEMTDDDWKALPREVKALVSEVSVDREKGTVKLKLEPRLAAEARLAKLQGWDKDQGVKVDVEGKEDKVSVHIHLPDNGRTSDD